MQCDGALTTAVPGRQCDSTVMRLYRLLMHSETGLANTEDDALDHLKNAGILPKDPDANCTALQHILDGTLKSQYISMTLDFDCAMKLAIEAMGGTRNMDADQLFIAEIDFNCETSGRLIDLTDACEISRSHRDDTGVSANKKASHCTKWFQELLSPRSIQPEEVVGVTQVSTILEEWENSNAEDFLPFDSEVFVRAIDFISPCY